MVAIGVVLDWNVAGDPCARNVGLRAAKLLKRSGSDLRRCRHAGGGGQHTVSACEIAAKTNGRAREPHRFLVVATDELGEAGRAVIKRQKRIARA